MNYKIVFLYACLISVCIIGNSRAQEVLTLEEAVRIALERNYDIKLVANNVAISKNNVSYANAGAIPNVTGTLGTNNNIVTGSQIRVNGPQEFSNARNSSINYGVGLNWTIFDGFGMFARYDQLKELQKLSEANLQVTVLSTVGNVVDTYYDLVQQQQQINANKTAIEISRLRVNTAQTRFQIGKAARLEVLNAQVDYNTDTTNYLRQQELYNNTQIQLNELLARDITQRFRVIDTVIIDRGLALADLAAKAAEHNPSLQAALINRHLAELDLKQVRANRYPTIGVNSGYNFSRSQSAVGFASQNNNRGLNYGLSASVNIFNGLLQRTNEQNAAIGIQSAEMEYSRLNQNISAQLAIAYQTYLTSIALVNLEEANQRLAKQNLDITLEKYRLGTLTPLEFRDAQLNFLNARVRYSNALNQAKLAEIALKEIAGTLNLL